jgi:hypothetical protein
MDMHKIKLFPLSLSSIAFNWFTSLASNSVTTWALLEQKFHDYFYSSETKLGLSDLASMMNLFHNILEGLKVLRTDVTI